MREKMLCVVLAGLLAVSLPACSSGGEGPSAAPTLSQPVETVMPSAEPSLPAETVPVSAEPVMTSKEPAPPPDAPVPALSPDLLASMPDREYQPWQEAYMGFLSLMCRAELDYDSLTEEEKQGVYREAVEDAVVRGMERYYLYDVDKDGVPELLAGYASGPIQCYTWQEDSISSVGWIDDCNGWFCTCPGENGILLRWGSAAGMFHTMIFSLENRELNERMLCSQEGITPYEDILQPEDLVPGAVPLNGYRICADKRTGTALLLPVCNYYEDVPEPSQTPLEEARTAVLGAIAGEQPLFAVSRFDFDDNTGWMTWEEYVQRGVKYDDFAIPFQIEAHTWVDLDGDGREECAVRLWAEDICAENLTVLSERDGVVYAYWLDPFGRCELTAEGLVYNDGDPDNMELQTLSFYREQCYLCWCFGYVPSGQYAPVEWVDGSPTG